MNNVFNHSFHEFVPKHPSKNHHVDFCRLYVDPLLIKHNQLVWMRIQNLRSAQNLALSILLHQVKVLILAHDHSLNLKLFILWSLHRLIHLVLWWSLFHNQVFGQLQLDLLNDSVSFLLCWLFVRVLLWSLFDCLVQCRVWWFSWWADWILQIAFFVFLNYWLKLILRLWNLLSQLDFWFWENAVQGKILMFICFGFFGWLLLRFWLFKWW